MLIEKYELVTRLAELDTLTHEADERGRAAPAPTSAELKDVWRPDIDIRTAIRARVAADQAPRLQALAAELAEVEAANAASEARIAECEAQTRAAQAQVTEALALLDKVGTSFSWQLQQRLALQTPDDEQALRDTLEALLTDLGL